MIKMKKGLKTKNYKIENNSKEEKYKAKKTRLAQIILIIIGIEFILYPIVSNMIYNLNQTIAITKYKEDFDDIRNPGDLKDMYKEYNKDILEKSISSIDLMKIVPTLGYIEIPKINVKLIIYEGTSNDVLSKGVGHLENTSIPGQNSTNCVLAGHTGLAKAKVFDDLDKLELEDEFFVTMLNETFSYKVRKIKTVKKEDVKDLKVIENKEYVTLVTCTPKFINSHRLLIIGERVI